MANNHMPISGEGGLQGFAVRLLQADVARRFGDEFTTIANLSLELESWSHALQECRARATAVRAVALEKSRDERGLRTFLEQRKLQFLEDEIRMNRARFDAEYASALFLEGMKADEAVFAADLQRVKTFVAEAERVLITAAKA